MTHPIELVETIDALYAKATPDNWHERGRAGCIVKGPKFGPAKGMVAEFDCGNYANSKEEGQANAALACTLVNRWPEIRSLLLSPKQVDADTAHLASASTGSSAGVVTGDAVASASVAPDTVVGHKTIGDGKGGHRHEPLTRSEADCIIAAADAAKADRTARFPTEEAAIRGMWDAYQRLRELGWREAIYCPKDGTYFDAIEAGSTGVHDCTYHGEWPTGGWWVADDNDLWPSHPTLYRLREAAQQSTAPAEHVEAPAKSTNEAKP